MTDDMQRVLADIIERHIVQTPCGTGFLTDPSKVDWRGVIADLRREAARSASGGVVEAPDYSKVHTTDGFGNERVYSTVPLPTPPDAAQGKPKGSE